MPQKDKIKSDFISKRVLVTGGLGFIGSALVERLLEHGASVCIFDNYSFGYESNVDKKNKNLKIEKGDIRDVVSVENVLKKFKPEYVFHLAALHFIPYCNDHPVETIEVNVLGSQNVCRAAEKQKIKSMFFASTAAVYSPKTKIQAETSLVVPDDIYGMSKLAGESVFELFAQKNKVRTVVGRFFNAIGPRETNPHLFPEILKQIEGGKRELLLGNLDPRRDYINVYDMVEAVLLMAQKNRQNYEIVNIGSGKAYSVKEIVNCFEKAVGEEINITQDKSRVRKSDRPQLCANIAKIKQKIAWKPKNSVTDTIKILLKK